jgi:hypothetical protein
MTGFWTKRGRIKLPIWVGLSYCLRDLQAAVLWFNSLTPRCAAAMQVSLRPVR